MELSEKFKNIFESNEWGGSESRSGTGSSLDATKKLRMELPFLFLKYDIKSILDIPCGDFNWMKNLDLDTISYAGADIVEDIVLQNRWKYPNKKFLTLDIINDQLPIADLVFVRDCLGHLSEQNVIKAIKNIQQSGSKYLLATSFPSKQINYPILDGQWHPINLTVLPFKLKPIYLINEDCREAYPYYNDKSMLLFDLSNLYSS